MDNRQASEQPRFTVESYTGDHGGRITQILDGGSIACHCYSDGEAADWICAAMNAADAREKSEACFECGAKGRQLFRTMCHPCIEEYDARVDRANDGDRDREIMERR